MSVRGLLFYRAELEVGSRNATAPLVPVEKDVFDGRQVPDGFFSLDTSYFKLVQHTSAVHDLHARTGLTPKDLLGCRIQVVNVWRAAEDFPLKRMPLALADQRTVSHLDAVSTPNEFNTHGAHGRVITLRANNNFPTAVHSENHTYWYFPDLQRDEAILLKTYDSIDYDRGADYRMCWHTGFHDPTTPPECGPRHSCEARVVLITPYSDPDDHAAAAAQSNMQEPTT